MTINPKPEFSLSFDRSYPGVSPQLLARTRQLWSARGLDLDDVWSKTIGRLRGFQGMEAWTSSEDSQPIDSFFMFDQAVMWVASLRASACAAERLQVTGLATHQWMALQALTFRMIEQLDAIRLLFLAGLPTPSMQIARSISEDVDMALTFVSRPKLAKRFVECATLDEANEFWRRHIAGGRAFKAVSQQLYRAGLEFDESGEYADWRKQVQAILGTAAHTSFHSAAFRPSVSASGQLGEIYGCLYFVTLRLQEMCAYSHALKAEFAEDLAAISREERAFSEDGLERWTPLVSEIAVDQLRWTLSSNAWGEATV